MEIYKTARLQKVFGLRRSSFLWCFFILFYIMYLVTGSFMFAALESPLERTLTNQLKEKYLNFLMENSCVSEKELQNLIEEIIKASKRGIVLRSSNDSLDARTNNIESNWSFSQSFFFVVTLLTTIGYGHITPISRGGKLFCMLYTLVGIPLTLVFGSAAVQRLMIPVTYFQQYLLKRLNPYMSTFYIKILHLLIMTLVLLIFVLFIPAMIFAYIEEDWDLLDALYYCFITMTTVGLGDYIPGDGPKQKLRSMYKFISAGYLLVDFVSVLLIVFVFNEIPQLNIGILFKLEHDERTNDPERVHLNESSSIARNYTECSSTDLMICDRGATPIPDEPSSTASTS